MFTPGEPYFFVHLFKNHPHDVFFRLSLKQGAFPLGLQNSMLNKVETT
jgi:hypothetical protein